nr:unnamed protein product [Digitaria exilis]
MATTPPGPKHAGLCVQHHSSSGRDKGTDEACTPVVTAHALIRAAASSVGGLPFVALLIRWHLPRKLQERSHVHQARLLQ